MADSGGEGIYSEIVVGTDGSATAGQAVRHAAALAKATGATLHVVHVFSTAPALSGIGPEFAAVAAAMDLPEMVARDAKAVLERALDTARAHGARVEGHLCTGDPADALLDTAEQVGADLLVVGNKGMSGVRRFVLGSVPNKVSHHCRRSLLIVNTTG